MSLFFLYGHIPDSLQDRTDICNPIHSACRSLLFENELDVGQPRTGPGIIV